MTATPSAPPRTLTELYFLALARHGHRPVAMRAKRDGQWQDLGHGPLATQVQHLSVALLELGIRPGDRVAILSENRPEWAITDYACLCARAADVPLYPTLPARQLAYILRDSGAAVVFVSTPDQLAKIREVRAELPALRHVVAFDAAASGPDVRPFEELLALGARAVGRYPRWEAEARQVRPDDLATLIYTSGTTGEPKGVMLTHGNITSNVVDSLRVLQVTEADECLSFLPLSHIFERMVGHYLMFHCGCVIAYATDVGTVAAEMAEVRPTVMAAVPRLYEKIYQRVVDAATTGGALKRTLFLWASRHGNAWAELAIEKEPIPPLLGAMRRLGDLLVFRKLRARTGGRLRFFISGGAPLAPELARFFYAAGLPVLEGYGLTETSPVISVNTFEFQRLRTVGKPIPNVEVRIADDGEILCRGPNVMAGYFNKPEDTRAVLDPDGWFHTGDIGRLDADGFLAITDRKKDLIVTAGGKNIAPQPIENLAKTSQFVSSAVMIGDRRKYPILLVVPDGPQLTAWARKAGLEVADLPALLQRTEVQQKMDREVKKTLRDLAQFEVPKKLLLLAEDFSIERGELTPKLSVRRKVVEERYREQIERLYQGE